MRSPNALQPFVDSHHTQGLLISCFLSEMFLVISNKGVRTLYASQGKTHLVFLIYFQDQLSKFQCQKAIDAGRGLTVVKQIHSKKEPEVGGVPSVATFAAGSLCLGTAETSS